MLKDRKQPTYLNREAIIPGLVMEDKKVVQVVVFDLNGTFYNKSSKDEFFKFICSRRPGRFRYIFEMAYYLLLHKLHRIRQTEFKENFFNYLDELPPATVASYAKEFWQREFPANFNKELLERFEHCRKNGQFLFCATGGLELYVKPLFDMYRVDSFAGTKVIYNGKTYVANGLACKDEEKVKRLEKNLNGQPYEISEAYSDSEEEILYRAEKAFLIKKGNLVPYNK